MVSDSNSVLVQVGDDPAIEAFLAQRIYEHNAKATGFFDAAGFCATRQTAAGEIQAGISGYTWGGCCHVTHLWVSESQRGQGLGSALLAATEQHARAKNCAVVLLSSHSFQAPEFYERRGYKQQSVVRDDPVGFANVFFAKRLDEVRLL